MLAFTVNKDKYQNLTVIPLAEVTLDMILQWLKLYTGQFYSKDLPYSCSDHMGLYGFLFNGIAISAQYIERYSRMEKKGRMDYSATIRYLSEDKEEHLSGKQAKRIYDAIVERCRLLSTKKENCIAYFNYGLDKEMSPPLLFTDPTCVCVRKDNIQKN